LERVWIQAISLLMLSRAAVKTLGTGMVSQRLLRVYLVLGAGQSYVLEMAWSVLWRGWREWSGLFTIVNLESVISRVPRSLTLLLKGLDDIANSLFSMSVRLLCHWILWTSVATYIFDSGVLVDLALQILEDALAEKRVCRHDVLFVLCCCVVSRCLRLFRQLNLQTAESSTVVKFERLIVVEPDGILPNSCCFARTLLISSSSPNNSK
jgi:hypothetical protein